MKKSDLKTGIKMMDRRGHTSYVYLNTPNGDIFSGERAWGELDGLTDDLKSKSGNKEYDIISVYISNISNMHFYKHNKADYCVYNLLWQRREQKEYSFVEARLSDKTIKPVINNTNITELNNYQKFEHVCLDLSREECKDFFEELINGKWYIKED